MADNVFDIFSSAIREIGRALESAPPEMADRPWREGGWTRKQIVGHLLDSAANNRQRFVRASLEGAYNGPTYAQDGWVAMHGYSEQSWPTLLRWWMVEHEILIAVVKRIPAERLNAVCTVGHGDPVTLRYLVEDYITHLRWHLNQITAAPIPH